MIRVLVVEDSLTIRKRIVELLQEDGAFEVVGEADDGKTAIELCGSLRPDVVTMDIVLPVMSGLAATEWIMAYCPTPIVVVSSATQRGELFRAYDAIAAGAVDVLAKPNPEELDAWAPKLKSAVRIASRIRVVTHPRAKLVASHGPRLVDAGAKLVAIGASTGGPAAVRRVLVDLPAGFGRPILLVMHVATPFDVSLADWLDAQSSHRVALAVDGMPLPSEGVTLAPAGLHMIVEGGRVRLSDASERHSCKPSIDVLFESLASERGAHTAAALLTGMGKDGAAGLLAIRHAGGRTVAQDERTSVVYGMPRAAFELGAAEAVLPIERIGEQLSEWGGHG